MPNVNFYGQVTDPYILTSFDAEDYVQQQGNIVTVYKKDFPSQSVFQLESPYPQNINVQNIQNYILDNSSQIYIQKFEYFNNGFKYLSIDNYHMSVYNLIDLMDSYGPNQPMKFGLYYGDMLRGNDVINLSHMSDEISGSSGNDKIYGNGGNDILDGGSGTDTLYGHAGNDTLRGNEGNDALYGGRWKRYFIR